MPLIAPPVPTTPAIKPEKTPPKIEFFIVGFMVVFLKIIKNKLVTIKKIANSISNSTVCKNLLIYAPIITKITAGIPTQITKFLSKPFLKNAILVILLDT